VPEHAGAADKTKNPSKKHIDTTMTI